jgi:integrase/recombinase XerD
LPPACTYALAERHISMKTRPRSPEPRRPRKGAAQVPQAQAPVLQRLLLHLASERGLAENSLLAYRRDLQDAQHHLSAAGKTLINAKAEDLRGYLRGCSQRGASTRTVIRRVAALRAFLRFRQIEGKDTTRIMQQLERPKPERSLPKVLNKEQVARLVGSPPPDDPYRLRDVAMLELLYACGLRASELCSLSPRDVNLQFAYVRVIGKGRKERVVPVGKIAIAAISNYLAELRPKLDKRRSDKLFLSRSGKALERVALWQLVTKHARRSGLLKSIGPHVLRHCFASHLVGGGADLRVVQELLGHSDISTTQVYTHVDSERLRLVHRKYHPRG